MKLFVHVAIYKSLIRKEKKNYNLIQLN